MTIDLNQVILDIDGNPMGSWKDCVMFSEGKAVRDEKNNPVIIKGLVDAKDEVTLGKMIIESLVLATHFNEADKIKAFDLYLKILPFKEEGKFPIGKLSEPLENILFIQKAIMTRYTMPIMAVQASRLLDPYIPAK